MSRAALSIFVFGIYMGTAATLLLLVPEQMCSLLSVAAPQEPWVRISGMFFLLLAAYCWRAGTEENTAFIRWTVMVRPTTLLFVLWFVAAGWIEPTVLVFGLIDVAASVWTSVALRRDAADGTQPRTSRRPAGRVRAG